MRILHLSKFYPPDSGGLERVVEALATGAAKAGHEVRVVCGVRHQPSQQSDAKLGAGVLTQAGVTVDRLATLGVLWSQPVVPRYLSAARWPADIMYVHRPHPLADVAVMSRTHIPTVVFHHSDIQRQRIARSLYRPLAHRVARAAQAVVVTSDKALSQAEDLGSAAKRAQIIPLGVDTDRFSPGEPNPRPPAFDPGRIHGLFVGRLVPYKGLDVLLDAVTQSQHRIVVVGSGPLENELRDRAWARGVSNRFVVTGEIPDPDLVAYYRACDYFVLPSTTPAEMFGVAQVEAMACGKPVITTDVGTGVGDVNIDGETGWVVPPGDVRALIRAMDTLAADADLREALGATGRSRVEERFSVHHMVARHLALCEGLVRSSDP